MFRKTIQALVSLNSDVRARSYAQITILGLDDHETDAKNRTSRNLDSELTNPLEMVKKTIQAFVSLNFEPKWAWNRREKSDFEEFRFWAHEPLRNS